ncbi:MAG: hypothetical protein KAW89_04015 [Armatimonadetes bacterium]|nr:hypothetical protein [Armatimonadota bacterium]
MNWRDIKWELTIIAVVVFILPPALWVYRDVTTARQLEAKLAALRAQGMPVTMTEAAPKPVPDDQNAAVLYQQVFQVQFGPRGTSSPGRSIGNLTAAEEEILSRYLGPADEQLTAQVHAILMRPAMQQDLEILRRASRLPHCVFPVNWEDGPAVLFHHMVKLKQATRLAAVQTALCAREGDVAEALDWCEMALRMSEHAASEPTIIAQLVAIAMQAMTLAPAKEFLAEAMVPPATANRFEQYLRQIDMYESFTNAVIGERAMGCDVFDMTYRQLRDFLGAGYGMLDPWTALYLTPVGRPLIRMDQMIYVDYMGKQIQLTKLPARTAVPKLTALETDLSQVPPWQGILTGVVRGLFSRAWEKRDEAEANIDLCRVVLTLKAYNYEHGRYPDSLQQLQQTLDWQLPQDPFSGQDFVYQRQANGFKLYSIGRDMDDDGGVSLERSQDYNDHDIVWECIK